MEVMASLEVGEILIGKKTVTDYMRALLTVVARGASTIVLKARGRNISRAVDVSQLAIRTLRGFKVSEVKIGSEEVAGGRRVSTIEIKLEKTT